MYHSYRYTGRLHTSTVCTCIQVEYICSSYYAYIKQRLLYYVKYKLSSVLLTKYVLAMQLASQCR